MHEVADAIIERQSQRLVTHGRFIADRFGDSTFEAEDEAKVAVPTQAPAGAPVAQSEIDAKRERVKVV